MDKLRARNVEIDESDPSQEDHGWYLTFKIQGSLHDAVVSHVPTDDGDALWLLCLERSVGILGSIIGRRHRSVTVEALQLVDETLQASPEVRDVQWLLFTDVRRGELGQGRSGPLSD
jgi:hypothetical protein